VILPTALAEKLGDRMRQARTPFKLTRAVLELLDRSEVRAFLRMLRQQFSFDTSLLSEFRLLDWPMLKDLVQQGVTIGSHTKSHALLLGETPDQVKSEMEGSRQVLEQQLGVSVTHFAYPDGRFDAVAIDAAAAAGYRTASTICAHVDSAHPLLTLPRKILWEKSCMGRSGEFSPAILSCQVNGIFAGRCRLPHWSRQTPGSSHSGSDG
ncbi:MAG: hypothetical protein RLZZ227_3163, partial [Pseudomonadota bacterium]